MCFGRRAEPLHPPPRRNVGEFQNFPWVSSVVAPTLEIGFGCMRCGRARCCYPWISSSEGGSGHDNACAPSTHTSDRLTSATRQAWGEKSAHTRYGWWSKVGSLPHRPDAQFVITFSSRPLLGVCWDKVAIDGDDGGDDGGGCSDRKFLFAGEGLVHAKRVCVYGPCTGSVVPTTLSDRVRAPSKVWPPLIYSASLSLSLSGIINAAAEKRGHIRVRMYRLCSALPRSYKEVGTAARAGYS